MKPSLPKLLVIAIGLLTNHALLAQSHLPELTFKGNTSAIDKIQHNAAISADSAYRLLADFHDYSEIKRTGISYVYHYHDPTFGSIPLWVYVPASYTHNRKSPCVMLLHGAVSQYTFADIDSLSKFEPDVLFDHLQQKDYIIIRPIADSRNKKFSWVVNFFARHNDHAPNPAFNTLNGILNSLKQVLNIDDDRVYAFGHSDGSDGAVGLSVFTPNAFAGIVAYNSMLTNIFDRALYIRNVINRPMYLVHSDLDSLRPIIQARDIVDSLKPIHKQLLYKEYLGYQHEDKHLDIDVPLAIGYLSGISRRWWQPELFWTTNYGNLYNQCDWLVISETDTTRQPAAWYHDLNFKSYNKRTKTYFTVNYYQFEKGAASAVKATYFNNTFNLFTSRVKEVEVLISPVMVNLQNPVIINVNGKKIFEGRVKADKNFLIENFKRNFDRSALWVTSVKAKVN